MAPIHWCSWKWVHLLFGVSALSVLLLFLWPGGYGHWPNYWEEWSFLGAITLPPTFMLILAARGLRAGPDWTKDDHRKLIVKEVRLALFGLVWGFLSAQFLPLY